MSCAGKRKLKRLVLLFRLDENRGPRKLRKDWERKILFSGHVIHAHRKEERAVMTMIVMCSNDIKVI